MQLKMQLGYLRYPLHCTKDDLVEARYDLIDLILSIEYRYAKSKAGSPHRTLSERRIKQ